MEAETIRTRADAHHLSCQGTVYRQTGITRGFSLATRVCFQCLCEGTNAAHGFLPDGSGLAIRLTDRLGRLAQGMERTELVGKVRKDTRDGLADRVLPIGDDRPHRHWTLIASLTSHCHEVASGPAEKRARHHNLLRQAVADHPEHVLTDIGLQPIHQWPE